MTVRLLRACQALEAAVTTAGSSRAVKTSLNAAQKVLLQVQRLHLVLNPQATKPVARPAAVPLESAVALVSEVKLVKPAKPRQSEVDTNEAQPSHWDPDPLSDQLEASRSRALLLEIVRRAIYDWVLYRGHARLEFKEIAADAYTWLFEEEPGHPWWRIRIEEKRMLLSLHAICDVLDLEPETIRARARTMTIKTILSVGRPPETRHRRVQDDADYQEHAVIDNVDLHAIDQDTGAGYYEQYYSVSTSM